MAESVSARLRATQRVGPFAGARFVVRAIVSICVGVTVLISIVSTEALAQSNDAGAIEARREFDLANAAFEARRYSEAAARFDASVALRPNALTLFIAAVSWDEAKQLDRAADDYARAVAVEGLDARRLTTAKTRLAELEQTLGTLVVTAPKGFRVSLDAPRTVPTPARVHAKPGRHTLTAVGPDASKQARSITIVAGQVRPIALTDDEPSDAPILDEAEVASGESATKPSHGWPASRVLGVTSMVLGAATMGGAVVLGLRVLNDRDAYYTYPTRQGLDDTRTLQTWTTAAWITGGSLVAIGGALTFLPELFHSRQSTVALHVSGNSVGIRGAF